MLLVTVVPEIDELPPVPPGPKAKMPPPWPCPPEPLTLLLATPAVEIKNGVPVPTKIPPPNGELPPVRAGVFDEITQLLIVTAPVPATELVATMPPPSPSSVLLVETSEFVTEMVPVPEPSQSNPPPKPSPAKELWFRPLRIVTPVMLVANAEVNVGLIDITLSMPLDDVEPA